MNILYGIQGTGHGHISRAKELLPELGKHASVDVLVSGYACQLSLDTPVKYRKQGISFNYDNNGGISILGTLKEIQPVRFISDIQSIPLDKYDLVVSDYEPVSAWAARMAGIPSVALSHQASFLVEQTPRPEKQSAVAEAVLRLFAPSDRFLGFHFKRYGTHIEPPIIRSEIRNLNAEMNKHITVYLPAYNPRLLIRVFEQFPSFNWHVFSPECAASYKSRNVWVHPVSNEGFLEIFESCEGVLTSAGFETSAEAMYLGKKLMVVPIKKQYEQLCNAAALKEMGVKVIASMEGAGAEIGDWLENSSPISLTETAEPSRVISKVLSQGETAAPDAAAADIRVTEKQLFYH